MQQTNNEGYGYADLTAGLQKNGFMILLVVDRYCVIER